MSHRSTKLLLATLAAGVAVSACSSTPTATEPLPTATFAAPSPAPVVPLSVDDPALKADAVAAIERFYAVVEIAYSDPAAAEARISEVAVRGGADRIQGLVDKLNSGFTGQATGTVLSAMVTQTLPSPMVAGTEGSVAVSVCLRDTGPGLVDPNGVSQRDPGAREEYPALIGVYTTDPTMPEAWRVYAIDAKNTQECTSSQVPGTSAGAAPTSPTAAS